jgi:hypothetical protein
MVWRNMGEKMNASVEAWEDILCEMEHIFQLLYRNSENETVN